MSAEDALSGQDLSTGEIRAIFKAHGLRCTRQREVIYAALAASKSHPTADDLYQQVAGGEESLSLATIYNTLEALANAGLCSCLATPGGPTRYDADVGEHVHVMLPDGRVIDLPPKLSADILESIPTALVEEAGRHSGAPVTGVRLQLIVDGTAVDAPAATQASR